MGAGATISKASTAAKVLSGLLIIFTSIDEVLYALLRRESPSVAKIRNRGSTRSARQKGQVVSRRRQRRYLRSAVPEAPPCAWLLGRVLPGRRPAFTSVHCALYRRGRASHS